MRTVTGTGPDAGDRTSRYAWWKSSRSAKTFGVRVSLIALFAVNSSVLQLHDTGGPVARSPGQVEPEPGEQVVFVVAGPGAVELGVAAALGPQPKLGAYREAGQDLAPVGRVFHCGRRRRRGAG